MLDKLPNNNPLFGDISSVSDEKHIETEETQEAAKPATISPPTTPKTDKFTPIQFTARDLAEIDFDIFKARDLAERDFDIEAMNLGIQDMNNELQEMTNFIMDPEFEALNQLNQELQEISKPPPRPSTPTPAMLNPDSVNPAIDDIELEKESVTIVQEGKLLSAHEQEKVREALTPVVDTHQAPKKISKFRQMLAACSKIVQYVKTSAKNLFPETPKLNDIKFEEAAAVLPKPGSKPLSKHTISELSSIVSKLEAGSKISLNDDNTLQIERQRRVSTPERLKTTSVESKFLMQDVIGQLQNKLEEIEKDLAANTGEPLFENLAKLEKDQKDLGRIKEIIVKLKDSPWANRVIKDSKLEGALNKANELAEKLGNGALADQVSTVSDQLKLLSKEQIFYHVFHPAETHVRERYLLAYRQKNMNTEQLFNDLSSIQRALHNKPTKETFETVFDVKLPDDANAEKIISAFEDNIFNFMEEWASKITINNEEFKDLNVGASLNDMVALRRTQIVQQMLRLESSNPLIKKLVSGKATAEELNELSRIIENSKNPTFKALGQKLAQAIRIEQAITTSTAPTAPAQTNLQPSGFSEKLARVASGDITPEEREQLLNDMRDELYNYNADQLSNIRASEFANLAWTSALRKDKESPRLLEMIGFFNNMSSFIQNSILTTTPGEEGTPKRVELLKFYIDLLDKCVQKGDFNSAFGINAAMATSSLFRLNKARDKLPQDYKERLENHKLLLEQKGNYANLRKKIEELEEKKSSFIPYPGMYLTDLTMLAEANNGGDFRDKETGKIKANTLLNLASDPILKILSQGKKGAPKTQFGQEIKEIAQKTNDDALFAQSLKVEPREKRATQQT